MANTIGTGTTGAALIASLNEVIEESNLYDSRHYWAGKKPVFIGDSITAQGDDAANSWILQLCELMDWDYVAGNQNMGVAGSGLMPYNDLGTVGDNSIYKRCDDVAAKGPDIIFIVGGENDDINLTLTMTEAVYTGATFSTASPQCGIIGALKGCLKKLRDGSPNATIVLMTNFLTLSFGDTNAQKKIDRHWAFRQIAPFYGARYLNNLEVGITPNIHPTSTEGEKWGRWIARQTF